MYPRLLHLYGPFYINAYGTMIALGIALFTYLVNNDVRRKKLISSEHFYWMMIIGIMSGIIGGRLLYVLLEWQHNSLFDIFALWNGGFAVLGSLICILGVAPWYLKKHAIPLLPFLDLIALYAPLLQSISRLGCFFAGCCYGKPTHLPWAIVYNNEASIAPLGISLHPSQLYSAFLLLGIFFLLYYCLQHILQKNGQLVCCYILLMATERYITDFFRGDNVTSISFIGSIYQALALGLIVTATAGLLFFSYYRKTSIDRPS